ncbi:MAG: translation initiation factor IF-2 [Clostridia bacterium]|nr:translation initiation factor IF-2 [Clostridia bacterium]
MAGVKRPGHITPKADLDARKAAKAKEIEEQEKKVKAAEEAKLKAEAEAKAKKEAEEKAKAEAEAKAKKEAEEKAKAEAEAKAKKEAEEKAKAEAEAKAKKEAEEKAKKDYPTIKIIEKAKKPEEKPVKKENSEKKPFEKKTYTNDRQGNRNGKDGRRERNDNRQPRDGKPNFDKKDGKKFDGKGKPNFEKKNNFSGKDKDDDKSKFQKPRTERPSQPTERMAEKPNQKKTLKKKYDEHNKYDKFDKQNGKGGYEQKSLEKAAKPKKHSQYKQQVEVEEDIMDIMPSGTIAVTCPITVGGFAELTEVSVSQIAMALMKMGIMANINQSLDEDTVNILAAELGIEVLVTKVEEEEVEEGIENFEDKESDLKPRAPFVTVMGHVDHGKTSLLDAIRSTNVAAGESGGITQHIGASEVTINGQKIVFLDTPGHEAFTQMRARGAHVTDIAVLVVAADDGVMPQTIESISHAKAAGVPIIVAINKMDKPTANPDRVKQELTQHGILVEDWGGDVISVPVSAKTGEGVTNLLEMILLQAEVLELKANPNRLGKGSVVEARLDKNRGPVATLLVDNGTLRTGQSVVVGNCYGRVRLMTDFKGKTIAKAGPATAVEILGLDSVPEAGDEFNVVKDDKTAREIAERRKNKLRDEILARNAASTLEQLFSQIQEGETKDLNLIVKADVQGSVEAIIASLEKLSNSNVRVRVTHSGVGTVNESDVTLASTTGSIIIGFNVRPTTAVQTYADQEKVQLRLYRVIYDIINDIEDAMKGMLDPEFKEEVLGKIEVRETFRVPGVGTIAGAYVQEGKAVRNAQIRLVRDGIVIHEGKISSLKRFKDDAKEVATGFECGIGIENYNDIQIGDIFECFHMVEVERK